jgi:hypothetical protein
MYGLGVTFKPGQPIRSRPARPAPLTDRHAADAASVIGAVSTVAMITTALVAVTAGASG